MSMSAGTKAFVIAQRKRTSIAARGLGLSLTRYRKLRKAFHEQRKHMSDMYRGRKLPASTIAKMSAALKGRKKTPEHVANATAAIRAYHAKRKAERST